MKNSPYRARCLAFVVALAGFANHAPSHSGAASDATAAYVVRLPGAMTSEDIARCAALLVLSNEQRTYFESFYENGYRADYDAALERGRDSLHRIAALPGVSGLSPQAVEHASAFLKAQAAVCDALERLDSQLFSQLELVLAEPQRQRLPLAIARRQRFCTNPDFKEISEARIDLWRMFSDLEVDNPEGLAAVFEEYDRKVTPYFLRVDRLFRERNSDLLWYLLWRHYSDDGQLLERGSALQVSRSESFGSMRRAILAESCAAQLQIRSINRSYLQRIQGVLTDVSRRSDVQQTYFCAAYPEAYPDRNDMGRVFDSMMLSAHLSEELKAQCQQRWVSYRSAVEGVNTEMRLLLDRAMEDLAKYQGIVNHVRLREQLREARGRRFLLHEQFISYAKGLVPPVPDPLADVVAESVNHLKTVQGMSASDAFPGW